MKIRKHRKREWWFFPPEGSKMDRGRCYTFKYKSDMMRFINKSLEDAVNGVVHLEETSFGGSYCIKTYDVWHKNGVADLRLVMRTKPWQITKGAKRWFAHSDAVMKQMLAMQNGYTKRQGERLIKLFYQRGFKDFEPNTEEWDYINWHIKRGIDFYHWSDRCNTLRTKTIIEYLKQN